MKPICVLPSGAILALLMLLPSCATMDEVIRPEGDIVEITMLGKGTVEGELLAVTDSELVILSIPDRSKLEAAELFGTSQQQRWSGYVQHLPLHRVQKIAVLGYVDRNWIGRIVAFEAVPTVMLTLAAASVKGASSGAVLAFGGGLTALTFFVLAASTPSVPVFSEPFVPSVRESVRKHCRFAQVLTPEQLAEIESQYRTGTPIPPGPR